MRKILSLILAFILTGSLFACTKENINDNKEINAITDFSKFAGMVKGTDKIEVTFDNHSGTPFYFTIEEKEDIDEIMDIIFSSSFEKQGKELNDGDHTSIKIIQGENTYNMHILRNKEGQYYYSFSSNKLQDKISELAREAGAYGNVD